jgi:hypothetical protein
MIITTMNKTLHYNKIAMPTIIFMHLMMQAKLFLLPFNSIINSDLSLITLTKMTSKGKYMRRKNKKIASKMNQFNKQNSSNRDGAILQRLINYNLLCVKK